MMIVIIISQKSIQKKWNKRKMDEKMKKMKTDDLLNQLVSADSPEALAPIMDATRREGLTFSGYYADCLARRELTKSEAIRRSGLDRTYAYQILEGTRSPGRDKVLALAMGAGLSLDAIQRLLKLAGQGALYPRLPRDAAILFAIGRGYSVIQTNELLAEAGEEPIL